MKKLICQNCKHVEDVKDMNTRENSKMYMQKAGVRHLDHPDLHIYVAICFSCESLILFASKFLGGVEYFETVKLPRSGLISFSCGIEGNTWSLFNFIYNVTHSNGPDHVFKKLKEIKNKQTN